MLLFFLGSTTGCRLFSSKDHTCLLCITSQHTHSRVVQEHFLNVAEEEAAHSFFLYESAKYAALSIKKLLPCNYLSSAGPSCPSYSFLNLPHASTIGTGLEHNLPPIVWSENPMVPIRKQCIDREVDSRIFKIYGMLCNKRLLETLTM